MKEVGYFGRKKLENANDLLIAEEITTLGLNLIKFSDKNFN